MQIPVVVYDDRPVEWWKNPYLSYDEFIKEKYDYCRYYFFEAIRQTGENIDEAFMYPKIFEILTKKNYVRQNELKINAEQLYETYKLFAELVSEINQFVMFIPSIQTFCAFCNISLRELNKLQNLNDDIMDDVLNTINDYLVTSLSYAGQQGKASASVVSTLLKSDGNALITEKKKTEKTNAEKPMSLDDIGDKLNDILNN